jgi:hypothetical protein
MRGRVRSLVLGLVAAVALFASVPVFAQSPGNVFFAGGSYQASAYSKWGAAIASGNTATGSQTITVCPAFQTTPDGHQFNPWNTTGSFTFDAMSSSNSETLTPSAVSQVTAPPGYSNPQNACENVTATFSNTHGSSLAPNQVISGDFGISEAIADVGTLGGGNVFWQVDTGTVTLNTGALTTTTTVKVPTNFFNLGGAARVMTTITTSANWAVGISGATAIFCSANSTLTAGTTCLANQVNPTSTGTTSALTAILFTMGTSNPGAGAIKARVWGFTPVQPSS